MMISKAQRMLMVLNGCQTYNALQKPSEGISMLIVKDNIHKKFETIKDS